MCFTAKPDGEDNCDTIDASKTSWMPKPNGVPTGTYYLRTRTQDVAGNWSAWGNLFTFRYDGTPPENPAPAGVVHRASISTAWQNTSNAADFTWPPAHDEGSGLKGYYVAWGLDPDATSATFITAHAYQDIAALCAANAACTGYLRLRSEDKVGNLAEEWNTVFILRYDNAPPVVDFTFNGGATQTNRSQLTLDVTSSDPGSGVYAARFSSDGVTWEEWEKPSEERLWLLPPISRQTWPVYAQVKDQVGLLSEVVTHSIYLDVNPGRTSSANFILFDQTLSGGSGAHASDSYQGHGTLGQVPDSPFTSSAHYKLRSGYEAGSQANPLTTPGHEEYTLPGGDFASGVVSEPLQSASYRLIVASGGIGLPASPSIGSDNYQHQSGFLAQYKRTLPFEPDPVDQPDGEPTDPQPVLTCDAPSVTINAGAAYTDNPLLNLSLCAPFAAEMRLSARDDFAGAAWEPFVADKAWVLTATGSTVAPYFIYAQFKDIAGGIHTGYFDDILYDPNQPQGALLLSDDIPLEPSPTPEGLAAMSFLTISQPASALTLPVAPDGSVTLFVDGSDDNSGVTEMQISATPSFADAAWQPFSPTVQYTPDAENGSKLVYARFRDEAGNISSVSVISFIYDIEAPVGYLYADPSVLPGHAVTTTLYMGDYNAWEEYYEGETPTAPTFDGSAVEMRIGTDPTLADAYWQPLAESVTANIDPALAEGIFYAQYRDAAGNVSEIVSATYQVDTFAPDLTAYAEPGDGTDRLVNIYAIDNLSGVLQLHLSNDPLMQEDVVTQPDTSTLTWTYDDQRVMWIVAEDGVGNLSEPYPVFATELATLEPFVTISGNAGTGEVNLSYLDGDAKVVTTDDTGLYTITVPLGWSGTVTPSKTGYAFAPENRQYTGLENNAIDQNYVASVITPPTHPGNFDKTSPVNGVTGQSTSLALIWGSSSGATLYEYCFDTSNDNACSNWVSAGTATSANLSGLAVSTTYYWHVRASNAGGTTYANGNSTAFWSFTTGSPVATFDDVPVTYWAWSYIERLYNSGITGGCSTVPTLKYCPDNTVTRAQMAVFLLKSMHGKSYTPPLVVDSTGFGDVATSHWAAAWIKQLAAEGITGGCGNGNYCPENPVTRAQMAVFLLKAKNGSGYTPPVLGDGSGFGDVPNEYWAARWIKQLAAEGITGGCGAGTYCPEKPVTRAQMAVFIVRTFGLP